MNVSKLWLNEYIDVSKLSGDELAALMTSGGIEIDVIEDKQRGITDHFVIGEVVTKREPEGSQGGRNRILTIDVGSEKGGVLTVVTNNDHVEPGHKVVVATVGAHADGIDIVESVRSGVTSQGMLCAGRTLGLNEKAYSKDLQIERVILLPSDAPVGELALDYFALRDEVLMLELTPNRSDCLSMYGVAHEVAALTGTAVKWPEVPVVEGAAPAAKSLAVSIDPAAACSHYTGRIISGVNIGPSPQWLVNRLAAASIRSINNVVDVTNYVMLELGQPLHAFDADKVGTGTIHVRMAREGETLKTLDGQVRTLTAEMLVITDGTTPIALAGVMGGESTEVDAATTTILLESARFDGGPVRKTSKQLGLRSESSARFEKGVDPARVQLALDRAAALIAELAGGTVHAGVVEARNGVLPLEWDVDVSLAKINQYLGTALDKNQVGTMFKRLGFKVAIASDTFTVTVPSRRSDITIAVDLIEEVARLYGYDHIPTTPIEGTTTQGELTKQQALVRELRGLLTTSGLHEVVSYSLTDEARTSLFPALTVGNSERIRLALPMSEERAYMRTALAPQLMEIATYNRNRQQSDIAIFEIGKVFHTQTTSWTIASDIQEVTRLGILMSGNLARPAWNRKAEPVDFYAMKGIVEKIAQQLGVELQFAADETRDQATHPGRTAAVLLRGQRIGTIAQLDPRVEAAHDLGATFIAELDLEPLTSAATPPIQYRTLPKYPAIQRDIALVVAQSTPAQNLLDEINTHDSTTNNVNIIESVSLFDVYEGEHIEAGFKSIAISIVYRNPDATLTDEEVSTVHADIVSRLKQNHNAVLRT